MRQFAIAAILLVGCATDDAAQTDAPAPVGVSVKSDKSAERQKAVIEGVPVKHTLQTIYFDFDRAEIRADQLDIAAANAQYLIEHPGAIRLQGHTDNKGEAEYNLALGLKRARAVQRYLVMMGIDQRRIEVHSFGEESPVGTDTENRRVEFR